MTSSTYYICGDVQDFLIRKVLSDSVVNTKPFGYNTDESVKSTTLINLDLVEVKPIKQRLPLPAVTKLIQTLIYQFPNQELLKGRLSEEIIKKSEQILGTVPVLPQPTLEEAPPLLIPVKMPKEQIKNQVLEQLKKIASLVSTSPESCSSKDDIAGHFASVAQVMRYLDSVDLKELEDKIKVLSVAEGPLKTIEKLFYDVLVTVGTNPSTMIVVKKVKEGQLPKHVLVKMIQFGIRNVRYPTEELLNELVKMVKSETVQSDRRLLTTAITQLSDLFYRAYVNPTTMVNNFPTRIFGVFGTMESPVLSAEYIPYLTQLVEGSAVSASLGESGKKNVRYGAIVALGKTGHLKGLETLLKAVEGKLPKLGASSQNEENDDSKIVRPLAIHSLKHIAKRNPDKLRPILMTIALNNVETDYIRIAAVAMLPYTLPSLDDINQLAKITWQEKSMNVVSFIRTTLVGLSTNEVPEWKYLQLHAKAALPLIKKFDSSFLYSKSYMWSKFIHYLQSGVVNRLSFEMGQDSFYPNMITKSTKFYSPVGAYAAHGLSYDVYMKGMDRVVEKALKYLTNAEVTSNTVQQHLEKISQLLTLQTRGGKSATEIFGHISFFGVENAQLLDADYVTETLEKVTTELENQSSFELNMVNGMNLLENTHIVISEVGLPLVFYSSVPVVYAAKGSFTKETTQSGLAMVEAKVIPVFNMKAETTFGIVWPFTEEILGAGVQASLHSSIPVDISARLEDGELLVSLKTPQELESNGREFENLHGLVFPYTFRESLHSIKPTSKSINMKKVISTTPYTYKFEVGQSVGLKGHITGTTDNTNIDLASYLEKIKQTSPSSILNVLPLPSTVRLSSVKLTYSPAQSETKEFQFRVKVGLQHPHGMSGGLQTKIIKEKIPQEFKHHQECPGRGAKWTVWTCFAC